MQSSPYKYSQCFKSKFIGSGVSESATAHINITSPHYDIQKVTLFDLFGKQEESITYNNSKEILVNLSNLLGGVYFVHIHLENGHTLIYKVSKE
ncbi:MAG: T9SS type A sorting domain-containing protein [Chitinophagales bacterium]|nr:T9SS type A sorting domain-containing protein [Chitinophagales bacterium]